MRFGVAHLADVLAGNDNEKVRSFGHDRLSVFGIANADEVALVRPVARALIARDALRADAYGGLSFGPGARPILKGEEELTIAVPPPRKRGSRKRFDGPADPLFDALREARRAACGGSRRAALRHLPRLDPARDGRAQAAEPRRAGRGARRRRGEARSATAKRCSRLFLPTADVQTCVTRNSVEETLNASSESSGRDMIRKLLAATAAIAVASSAIAAAPAAKKASATASATLPASNPFARPSTLPFQTPDFSRIKDSDYLPALLAGMAQQKREVIAIANNPAPPTFDNTVVAMERSGQLLERAGLAFSAVNGANTNDTLQATDTKTSPLLAAHNDFIYLNPKLFQRFKYLHDHQAELNLNPEQAKLLEVYYKQFVHAGAELPPAKQAAAQGHQQAAQHAADRVRAEAARRRQGRARCTSTTQPRSPGFASSSSLPRRRRPRTARSRATSCRCRTRRSSRRCSR